MLRDVKKVTAKGKAYFYFRTGRYRADGKEILSPLPDMADPKFGDSYASHKAAKSRKANARRELTVTDLADLYERSPAFTKELAKGSQRIYRIYLKQLKAALPTAPANLVEQADIAQMIDKRAEQPGAANSLLRVVNALFRWGRKRGHVTNNPGGDLDELAMGEHDPWPIPVLEAALVAEDDTVRLATHLLYFTALRFGDVLRLRWSDIRDGVIFVTPKKTEKKRGEMMIPLHESLAAELERHTPNGLTILTKPNGTRWHENTLRKRLQAFASALGVKVVPHGLRKNAVNALLEAGCSVAETASISGQSLQLVEHYAKKRDQGKLASAAILRWHGNRERKPNAGERNAK